MGSSIGPDYLAGTEYVNKNKSELAAAVATRTGSSTSDAVKAVNAVIDAITDEVTSGGKVSLQGFGTFSLRDRAARTAKNPKTGETVQIAAKKVGKFTPGSNLKF